MSKRLMNDDQWLNMLQECRSSGLTDRARCAIQGIRLPFTELSNVCAQRHVLFRYVIRMPDLYRKKS